MPQNVEKTTPAMSWKENEKGSSTKAKLSTVKTWTATEKSTNAVDAAAAEMEPETAAGRVVNHDAVEPDKSAGSGFADDPNCGSSVGSSMR